LGQRDMLLPIRAVVGCHGGVVTPSLTIQGLPRGYEPQASRWRPRRCVAGRAAVWS
jgi:hypothetical protein